MEKLNKNIDPLLTPPADESSYALFMVVVLILGSLYMFFRFNEKKSQRKDPKKVEKSPEHDPVLVQIQLLEIKLEGWKGTLKAEINTLHIETMKEIQKIESIFELKIKNLENEVNSLSSDVKQIRNKFEERRGQP